MVRFIPEQKIGIIGAGDIGLSLAGTLALKGYDVVVYNRYHAVDGRPSPYWLSKMGSVMDMNDSLQLPGCGNVRLTSELKDLDGSYAVVITAGAKRTTPDETREELAKKNLQIIEGYTDFVVHNPGTLILIISNPVDILTHFLISKVEERSKRNKAEIAKKIVGVSYIDTMRLKNAVKEFLKEAHPTLAHPVVEGIALGEHGPTMVPLMSQVKVNGQCLTAFASKDDIQEMARHTILRGNDIIKLTGASSVIGPAHAVMHMIVNIETHDQVSLPCSVWDGKRTIGKLALFESGAVREILKVTMSEEEEQLLQNSENALDEQYKMIVSLL